MHSFNIIVAIDEKRGIGKDGGLPWRIPEDLKRFKDITTATQSSDKKNAVIMGRKTWESLPEKYRPLRDRLNCVLTRDESLVFPEGVLTAQSFEDVFQQLESFGQKEQIESVFVIGGEQIFKKAIVSVQCQNIYVTHVLGSFNCDTFFPTFEENFILEKKMSTEYTEDLVGYWFADYTQKSQ